MAKDKMFWACLDYPWCWHKFRWQALLCNKRLAWQVKLASTVRRMKDIV